jgi:hypothetical protein
MQDARRACGIEALRGYQQRWFRACFASACRSMHVDRGLLKTYLGHSQGDILGEHYERVGLEQLRAEIVAAIEKWWHKSGTNAKSQSAKSNDISLSGSF